MNLFSYIITRDFGFAPNPFPPYCTLATCKPIIRKTANIGDIIVGFGSQAKNSNFINKMIYAMIVEEKITFDDYWNDSRFKYKKPVLNGSKKQMYGDNIYHTRQDGTVIQEDSHHSFDHGIINYDNLNRDISGKFVLISQQYSYFGGVGITVPSSLQRIIHKGRNHSRITNADLIKDFLNWFNTLKETKYVYPPQKFTTDFSRYKGEN